VLYRLDRLRELLGSELDRPATRLRLQLAIDMRKLL
jgi:DNA-binding PucR family transcriptional regulator